MSDIDFLFSRLVQVERKLGRLIAAPTFPIYDTTNTPNDAIAGQVAIGSDGSLL